MLLLLFLSEGRQRITQSRLGELSGASRSTGLRWIDYLSDHGLAERREHPTDKRRISSASPRRAERSCPCIFLRQSKVYTIVAFFG
ncbi:MarR family transcriptional regulator [Sphingomonas daechungensis]|uniref:MarR family transcriptional regulator n=1 Tax=Sphingomonas daechungensis TaxID=1176646 RepID=UPI0037DA588E